MWSALKDRFIGIPLWMLFCVVWYGGGAIAELMDGLTEMLVRIRANPASQPINPKRNAIETPC